MQYLDRTSAVILALSLLPFLGRFVGIAAAYADYYDEGAYYCSAERLAEGRRPYQDFRLVQPPGLVMSTALGIRAGLLLPGQRVVHALSGLILAGLAFGIAGRARDVRPYAPAMAVLLLVSSPLFFGYSRMVMTDLPATMLVAAAILVVTLGRRGHLALSAALVVAGSVFRLQSLFVFAPGILVQLAAMGRARDGVKFVLYVVVLAAIGHGAIQLAWPRYVEDVVILQGLRPRIGPWDRYRTVDRVISDPVFALGLVSAALLLGGPCPRGRGLGALSLSAVLLTATAFNSVYDQYFLMALPPLASCAGVVVGDAARTSRRGVAAVTAAVLVVAVEAPRLAEIVVHRLHESAREAGLIAEIRRHPGRTLLTAEPGFAIASGKRLPRDHDACDPYAAHLAGRFNAYVERALSQSDLILIGDRLIEYVDPENIARIVRSGKPLFFAKPADRSAWEAKAGQARGDPARR